MSQLTFDQMLGEEPTPKKGEKAAWYKGRTLSHSSISMYRTCPQKWKFRYIDKVPEKPKHFFSFGKSVHSGLEFLFSKIGEPLPSLDELISAYKTSWIREAYESLEQERFFFKEGERILKGFYAKHKNETQQVFKVEYKFNFFVEGVPILGFIDRIDKTADGKVNIIDYKTGKPFDKKRVKEDPQLTLYQMAVREELGLDVDTVTLYHLNSLTPVTMAAHAASLEQALTKEIVGAAQGISEQKFDPKPDEKAHCKWCDYKQICPAFAK